ncbi:MAG TPA: D-aminoacyl-tRNA deacylase [Nitrososphaerales archaeon]|nr:D-aminoacyl-tRNA deacylase [Nitrososphaerales archaeon]
MKTVIVCSLNDPAGTNIRDRLLDIYPFKPIDKSFDSSPIYSWNDKLVVSANRDIVFVDKLDETFGDCRYVFVSRHRAESGIPSLTAHFTGNFGTATFGGNPNEIAKYSPQLLKNYMIELNSLRNEIDNSYSITLEATHHGPTSLKSPVLFVELGSTEKEWKDETTARLIARALVSALDWPKEYEKCAIGIGGTHYPERLNRQIIDTEIALGPIIPKYALEYFNNEILEQILSKGDQNVNIALVDNKGLGKYKENVIKLLQDSGLERMSA